TLLGIGFPCQMRAFVQIRDEQHRLFGPQHQSAPELVARQHIDQWVETVVDFNQMFELHAVTKNERSVSARRRNSPYCTVTTTAPTRASAHKGRCGCRRPGALLQ